MEKKFEWGNRQCIAYQNFVMKVWRDDQNAGDWYWNVYGDHLGLDGMSNTESPCESRQEAEECAIFAAQYYGVDRNIA